MSNKKDEIKEKAERFEEITEKSAKVGAELVIDRLKDKGIDASEHKDEIEGIILSTLHGNMLMTLLMLDL